MQLVSKVVFFQLFVTCVLIIIFIFGTSNSSSATRIEIRKATEKTEEIENSEETENSEEILFKFSQPTYKDNLVDVSKFNYDGSCREPFKYKSNSKRDLLIQGVYYQTPNDWLKEKGSVIKALTVNKSGIPYAKRVLLLFGDFPEPSFIDIFNQSGVEVVPVKVENLYNGALLRYVEVHKYILQNREKYDRVFFSDLRDMFFFADGFATFSKDQLFMSYECSVDDYSKVSCATLDHPFTRRWMAETIGRDVADAYSRNKSVIINCGTIFGGTERVIALLGIYTKNIDKHHLNYWGYDQSLLTYLYYSGQFSHLNVTMTTCNQMFCFDKRDGCYYDSQNKVVYVRGSKCSPIMRHKLVISNSKISMD